MDPLLLLLLHRYHFRYCLWIARYFFLMLLVVIFIMIIFTLANTLHIMTPPHTGSVATPHLWVNRGIYKLTLFEHLSSGISEQQFLFCAHAHIAKVEKCIIFHQNVSNFSFNFWYFPDALLVFITKSICISMDVSIFLSLLL